MPTRYKNTALIILAAGHGTRMKSALPKVLHPIAHLPMVGHVLRTGAALGPERTGLVTGAQAPQVAAKARDLAPASLGPLHLFVQDPPRGTGDAVRCAAALLEGFTGAVFVLYADTPLLTAPVLELMREKLSHGNGIVVLGFRPEDPGAYGRLVMDSAGGLDRIVEAGDASPDELRVACCNSGVMVFDADILRKYLPQLQSDNAKGEFYLTDLVGLATEDGVMCAVVEADEEQVLGVNSRVELAQAEKIYQGRLREQAMLAGVSMHDPESVYFSWDTRLGKDVTLEPNIYFGPNVVVEEGAHIKAMCHIEGAHIGKEAIVGPFARLRPQASIGASAKIGNFVEIKKADLGVGAKVSHLSYIGDAEIGAEANIGAGTITCNYDGFDKYQTKIGEGAFVGSNSALVAPVSIGAGSYVGSGSVVVKDVSPGALVIARGAQVEKPEWAVRFRAAKKARLKNKS